ncbi:MAG: hypothetical protein H7144_10305, partial [Burkholderiales bacterium]|nr:hypothetical protein [Phycisphaerae bacterium]
LGENDYLLNIRDEIQRQFGVTISVTLDAKLRSADDLRIEPGIGNAVLEEENPNADGTTTTAEYLFSSLKQLATATEDRPLIGLMDLYQPTKPLRGDDATYIVRVVEASPAHPLDKMDDVKEQVERDVRRKHAFAKAIEAADSVVKDAAGPGGLSAVAGHKVLTSGWFGAGSPMLADVPEAAGYGNLLVTPIFGLQRGVASKSELPKRDIIKLQTVNKVAVAELFDVKTELTPSQSAGIRSYAGQMVSQQMMTRDTLRDWFDTAAVFKRTGYVPADQPAQAPEKPRQAAPGSPFMPG